MTARDFQDQAKKAGTPWFLAKGFDTSCPIGELLDNNAVGVRLGQVHDIDTRQLCRIHTICA